MTAVGTRCTYARKAARSFAVKLYERLRTSLMPSRARVAMGIGQRPRWPQSEAGDERVRFGQAHIRIRERDLPERRPARCQHDSGG